LDGKVAVITGASEGIGAACAVELAKFGVNLSLTARSEEGLRKAAPNALITPGDLTSEETRRAVVDRTLERFGAVDILINNAGIGCYLPSWSAPLDEARRLMELNYFAVLGMTQLVVPHMRARGEGVVVNVSSIGGKVALPWATLYSSTKYAVAALSEGMRVELRREGVRTMLVCPGYVQTGFHRNTRLGQPPVGLVKARRFAITPEECAKAIRRGLERDALTVVTPRSGWLLVALSLAFPRLLAVRLAKINGTA